MSRRVDVGLQEMSIDVYTVQPQKPTQPMGSHGTGRLTHMTWGWLPEGIRDQT